MTRVSFSHTQNREKEYLNKLLKQKDWFKRNNFPAFLPKDKAEINSEIQSNDQSLRNKITWLKMAWLKVEEDFFHATALFNYSETLSKYICHVSRFGPEGEYRCPNLLFVRLRTKHDQAEVIATVGHELIHLMFASLFESHRLNYPEREGMVDALMLSSDLKNIFPSYKKQSIGQVRPRLLKSILISD